MTRLKLLTTACGAVALATLLTATGSAQSVMNQRTFLTFSGPVELPGVTLPAGRYLFRLADSPSTRDIVQILSDDEHKMYATILAISAERMQPTGETVVTFGERPAGTPPAVKLWFYPGNTIGHEFVYPKDQAIRIARETNQSVLSAESNDQNAKLSRVSPSGEETAYNETETTGQTASNQSSSSAVGTSGSTAAPPSSTGTTGSSTPDQTAASTSNQPTAATESSSASSQSTTSTSSSTSDQTNQAAQPMTPSEHGAMVNQDMTPQEHGAMVNQPSGRQAVGTTGTSDQSNAKAERSNRLPKTASPLPLAGILGLLSMTGAYGVRRLRACR